MSKVSDYSRKVMRAIYNKVGVSFSWTDDNLQTYELEGYFNDEVENASHGSVMSQLSDMTLTVHVEDMPGLLEGQEIVIDQQVYNISELGDDTGTGLIDLYLRLKGDNE